MILCTLAAPMQTRRREGMTLLEVIVSMAIFLMSFIAIASLMNMGQSRAIEVQLQATALQKAQSKMSDVICGSEPLGSQSNVPFTEDTTGKWTWSMEADQDNTVPNLWQVKITVNYPLENNQLQVSLTEKVVDPSIKAQWYSNQLGTLSMGTAPAASASSTTGSTTGGATTGGATTGGATAGTGATMGAPATMGTPATTGNTATKTGTTTTAPTTGGAKTTGGGGMTP
jgi:prepilin-type N-terminal cleavage/methylation domain-containing protein